MMATPLLALAGRRLAPRIARRTEVSEESLPYVPEGIHNHVIIAGYGRIGAAVAERMKKAGIPWVATDSDPNNVNRARRAGLPVYYGDAGRIEVMEALGLADAKAMVIAINDAEKAVQLVALVHYVLPETLILSRAFDEEHAQELRDAGAPHHPRAQLDRRYHGRIPAEGPGAAGPAGRVAGGWRGGRNRLESPHAAGNLFRHGLPLVLYRQAPAGTRPAPPAAAGPHPPLAGVPAQSRPARLGHGSPAIHDRQVRQPGRAQRLYEAVSRVGAQEGIRFDFDRIVRTPNTVRSHRLLYAAPSKTSSRNCWNSSSAPISAKGSISAILRSCPISAMKPASQARSSPMRCSMAAGWIPAMTEDLQSRRIGINGVPFFVFNGRFGLSGAQEPEALLNMLDLAREEDAQKGVA